MTVPTLQPNPASVAELAGIRHREMQTIANRLGRMSKRHWDKAFAATAILFYGAVVGGSIALVPYWSATHGPSHSEKVQYIGCLVICLVIAIISSVARLAVKSEREDSVSAIKEDLDSILAAYQPPKAK